MSKYGLPYQGSKAAIAEKLCEYFPKADHFYDLFGGGGAISHCMLVTQPDKYQRVHYNEIQTPVVELLRKSIAGEFSYSNFKPAWISREEFFSRKDNDAYVSLCWSFGNNSANYIFGKNIETYKKSMHQAVVFGEFDALASEVLRRTTWDTEDIKTRRLYLRHKIEEYRLSTMPDVLHQFLSESQLKQLERLKQLKLLEQLERLERLEWLERLERLERLQRLAITSLDYREVPILPNSVVYCDVPYQNTKRYSIDFDHETFLGWAATRDFPVYISEFDISDDRLIEVLSIKKRGLMCGASQKKHKEEKLYWNGKLVGDSTDTGWLF
jgi:hypothetical protein